MHDNNCCLTVTDHMDVRMHAGAHVRRAYATIHVHLQMIARMLHWPMGVSLYYGCSSGCPVCAHANVALL